MQQPQLIVASPNASRTRAIAQTVSIALPNNAFPHQVKPVYFRNRRELVHALSKDFNLDRVALIDLTGLAASDNPWDVEATEELGLATYLLLSFPEVYFVFLSNGERAWEQFERYMADLPRPASVVATNTESLAATECDSDYDPQLNDIRTHHFICVERLLPDLLTRISRHQNGFRTLFDATKLRNVLKRKIADKRPELPRAHVNDFDSRLMKTASSIDEESSFLYLNAYVAYKAGFATWLCSSASETKRVHPLDPSGDQDGPANMDLVITDFELQFSDLEEPEVGYSTTENPDELINRIEQFGNANSAVSFYVITGDRNATKEVFQDEERHAILDKPYEGIFHLLRPEDGSDLARRALAKQYGELCNGKKHRTGSAEVATQSAEVGGRTEGERAPREQRDPHSVPFAVKTVTDRLLDRARAMMRLENPLVENAVLAGMLCLEAKELLSGLARTMYYEAVCRQHEAEVDAEATFFGIAANLHVEQRVDDLRCDLELARIRPSTRRQRENRQDRESEGNDANDGVPGVNKDQHVILAELNCTLQTANNLRVRLHQHEQFEAADECLRCISETEAEMTRVTLGLPTSEEPHQPVSKRVVSWLGKGAAKLTDRQPMRGWYERTGVVRQRLSPLGTWMKRRFESYDPEKVPVWPVCCAAGFGIIETIRVVTTRTKDKNWALQLPKRFGYLATRYFNYVTDYGTRISRLLEVNFTYLLFFWFVYFVVFSGGVWPPESGAEPLTFLERLGASGLHSVMLFVGGFSGMDNYITGEPAMSGRYLLYLTVCVFEVIVAYLHLGLLVALLYRKITRSK